MKTSSKNILEAKIVDEIKKYLVGNAIIHQRMQLSGTLIGDKFVPSSMKGFADFWTLYKGRYIELEAKRPVGGEQSDAQKLHQKKVETGGGEYYIITHPKTQLPEIYNGVSNSMKEVLYVNGLKLTVFKNVDLADSLWDVIVEYRSNGLKEAFSFESTEAMLKQFPELGKMTINEA